MLIARSVSDLSLMSTSLCSGFLSYLLSEIDMALGLRQHLAVGGHEETVVVGLRDRGREAEVSDTEDRQAQPSNCGVRW